MVDPDAVAFGFGSSFDQGSSGAWTPSNELREMAYGESQSLSEVDNLWDLRTEADNLLDDELDFYEFDSFTAYTGKGCDAVLIKLREDFVEVGGRSSGEVGISSTEWSDPTLIKDGKQDMPFVVSGLYGGLSKLNGVTRLLIPQKGKIETSLDSLVWKAARMVATSH